MSGVLSTTSVMRLDLLVCAFVLLLASATFLVAINQAFKSAKQAAPPPPVVVQQAAPPPQTVTVKCEAPPQPPPSKVYVDYGVHRTLFDSHEHQSRALDFPPKDDESFVLRADSIAEPLAAAQYDPVYPATSNAFEVEGVDGIESSRLSYQANDLVLASTMRDIHADFVEIGGPAAIDFEQTTRAIPLATTEDALAAGATPPTPPPPPPAEATMDTFQFAARADESTMELAGTSTVKPPPTSA